MSQQATEPVSATGTPSIDERIAAAAEAIGIDEEPQAPKPVAEPAAAEEPAEDEAEATADGGEAEAEAKDEKPKAKGKDERKQRNVVRDLAAEWATARRAQQANAKRAAELEERARQVESEAMTAREVAQLMTGDPIKAVERLAKLANISPSEYLTRLQHAYIHGEAPPKRDEAVDRELAEMRQQLQAMQAERQRLEQEAQARAHQQQLEQVAVQETQIVSQLAADYADEFPALAMLQPEALQRQIADAVGYYLHNGYIVGRLEVLQAANNVVQRTLDEYGLTGRLSSRAASAPATQVEKTRSLEQPRNGSGRYIPTNAAAAEGGAPRRPLTVEERLQEAAKVLWSSE